MESERAGGAQVAAEDEAVWSRAWEWPAWMRPSLPATGGRRPGRGTFALLLLLFFLPGAIGGLGSLSNDLDFARGAGSEGLFSVPTWLRVYYSAQVELTGASVLIVAGALVLLLWRRAGAALLALGLLADVGARVTVLVAYVKSHEAPGGSIAQVVAEIVSRLVLLGLAALLVLPRREPAAAPVEHAFAPPAP